ncbi:MAG: hypothetical protein CVV41_04225 [Candidatus Riflebacteria bacterium HGW-Riflebacteria-1]|jgi:hypothetical protein|nr:MAG: hypothetical protein CVV41_04225 [Candidatus Riflebacteria bacterium HGW-Riflebacteria-1]
MRTTAQTGSTSLYCLILITVFFVTTSVYEPLANELLTLSHRAQVQLQLSGLKTALLSYSADFRHLPFTGSDPARPEAYAGAWSLMITDEPGKNIFCNAKIPLNQDDWQYLGMSPRHYSVRWRGPYLDLPGKRAFTDKWGNAITYYCLDDGKLLRIFLHSAGEDGEYDLAHPKLASIARTLEGSKEKNWNSIFNFSQRAMLDAHQPFYDGDDLLLEVTRIPKSKLKPSLEKLANIDTNSQNEA